MGRAAAKVESVEAELERLKAIGQSLGVAVRSYGPHMPEWTRCSGEEAVLPGATPAAKVGSAAFLLEDPSAEFEEAIFTSSGNPVCAKNLER